MKKRWQRVALAIITSIALSVPVAAAPVEGWTLKGVWERMRSFAAKQIGEQKEKTPQEPSLLPLEPETTSSTPDDPPPQSEVGGGLDPNG